MEYDVGFNEKSEFFVRETSKQRILNLQKRLLQFSVDIVRLLIYLPALKEFDVIRYQLSKSASSVGANYEESQAASYAEFYQRIQICLREARETRYWLEIIEKLELQDLYRIKESGTFTTKLKELLQEISEIILIFGAISTKIKKSGKLKIKKELL